MFGEGFVCVFEYTYTTRKRKVNNRNVFIGKSFTYDMDLNTSNSVETKRVVVNRRKVSVGGINVRAIRRYLKKKQTNLIEVQFELIFYCEDNDVDESTHKYCKISTGHKC